MRNGRRSGRGAPVARRAVAAAGVGIVLLFGACTQGQPGKSPQGGSSTSATKAPGSGQGAVAPTTTAPARQVVRLGGSVDSFDRRDDSFSLHAAPGVTAWSSVVGRWGTLGNQAYLFDTGEGRNLAVTDQSQGDGAVGVLVAKVLDGAGLVFRYRGPADYWAVIAVPSYASWAVIKVAGGAEERVANIGPSPTADGTSVAVRMAGNRIDVILDDVLVKTIIDPAMENGETAKAGLTVQPLPGVDFTAARFDDFRLAAPADAGPS